MMFFVLSILVSAAVHGIPLTDPDPLQARIEKEGGQAVYTEMLKELEGKSVGERHATAHLFGEALYEAEGIKGLIVCDAHFSFGCFHAFIARAIETQGLSVVARMSDACLRVGDLACQHGIGHGLIAHLGYETDALQEALEICEGLPHGDSIGGCIGGAFMEYNLRTMVGEGYVRESSDHHEPCLSIPDRFRAACYFSAPQWWFESLSDDAFPVMGARCRTLEARLARTCFDGIGNIVGLVTEYDAVRGAARCDEAGSGRERLWCRSSAAGVYAIESSVEAAERFCQPFMGREHDYCMARAHNDADTYNAMLW